MIELFREIESHRLSAELNVASDIKIFLSAARESREVRRLWQELHSCEVQSRVLTRIDTLAHTHVDARYENPWDAALTIYVWLLSFLDANLGRVAAETALGARNCWWSSKLAKDVLYGGHLKALIFPKSRSSVLKWDFGFAESVLEPFVTVSQFTLTATPWDAVISSGLWARRVAVGTRAAMTGSMTMTRKFSAIAKPWGSVVLESHGAGTSSSGGCCER